MDDRELRARLRGLGIDEDTWHLAALLPLVQVAWADGEVQDAERKAILDRARRGHPLGEHGERVLEGWLTWRPSRGYFARGQEVLRALADRGHADATDLIASCEAVAAAAGGLFGLVGAVSADEREVVADVARALEHEDDWQELLDGGFEEDTDDDVTTVGPWEGLPSASPVAPAVAGPHLAISGAGDARTVALADALAVGRQADNDVRLAADGEVSRRHCRFVRDGARWAVVDCGSVNGTWVDGERVTWRQLFGGETVRVGHTELAVRL